MACASDLLPDGRLVVWTGRISRDCPLPHPAAPNKTASLGRESATTVAFCYRIAEIFFHSDHRALGMPRSCLDKDSENTGDNLSGGNSVHGSHVCDIARADAWKNRATHRAASEILVATLVLWCRWRCRGDIGIIMQIRHPKIGWRL